MKSLRSIFAAAIALAALSACADVPSNFGGSRDAARPNADSLLGSLTQRFTNVVRAPRYERAREQLGRYALTPSIIYNDTSLWTTTGQNTRTIFGDASFTNGKYVFVNAPSPTPLSKTADGRHVMRLTKLPKEDEYEWVTGVDFAVGSSITAADIHNVVNALLASAEGRNTTALRADYRSAFPRTTAALGKLVSLDTIISSRDAQGGNTVILRMRIRPDQIRGTYPKYAAYLEKYINRIRLTFRLTDRTGARWVELTSNDGVLTLRTRSANGHFAPLQGPVRPMPDTLALNVDMTAKVKVFTVGVNKLTGQWVNIQTGNERGWFMRFNKEPEWVLPPIVGHLIRSPLRRPFEGPGTTFRIAFRDAPGKQTLLSRQALTTVKESAVLRFLGKLGGDAMGDFIAEAEAEENRFNATVFAAMQADIGALLR